jgi:hypothetical protein
VTIIFELPWFLPFCDSLTREKGLIFIKPSNDRKDDLVRKDASYFQHHVTWLNAILR